MIHTESIAYVESAGKLVPLTNLRGEPQRYFISAPDIDSVRGLLVEETPTALQMPVLFITRQTNPNPPANDFSI